MSGLVNNLGKITADCSAVLKAELQARVRRMAIRTGILVVAAVLALVSLAMAALALFLGLSVYFSPSSAAAVTAAIFFVLAITALIIGLTGSFRTTGVSRKNATGDLERVTADVTRMAQDIHALAGRKGNTLVFAALAAGVAVSLTRKGR